jgi:CHAT domain-containing protein
MSLWKVPDESTSYLMKKFYTFLLQSNDANKALKMAMEETKKIYNNPYYWGGFIVLN